MVQDTTTVTGPSTTTVYGYGYSGYCGYRLPCGYCRLTNMPCHAGIVQPEITWTANGPSDVWRCTVESKK